MVVDIGGGTPSGRAIAGWYRLFGAAYAWVATDGRSDYRLLSVPSNLLIGEASSERIQEANWLRRAPGRR